MARTRAPFQSKSSTLPPARPQTMLVVLSQSKHPCAFQVSDDVLLLHPYRHQHRIASQHSASTGACKAAARTSRYLVGALGHNHGPVSCGYQLSHETYDGDFLVPAASLQVLSRQPYARKHVANHQGQSAGTQAVGFGCPTARPGARDSLICEGCQSAICVDEMPCPGSSQQHRGIRLRADLAAMQGLTATLRRVNASRSLAFHLGRMSDSASAYRPHMSHASHPLHPENCNCSQYDPCRPPMTALAPAYRRQGGLHTTRQPCWVAVTTIQPFGPSSHPTGYHHTLPHISIKPLVLPVDCGSPVACHCSCPSEASVTNPD